MKKLMGLLVVALSIIGLLGCGATARKLDIKDFVRAEVSGYNGEAVVRVSFDEDPFVERILELYGYTLDEAETIFLGGEAKEEERETLKNLVKVIKSIQVKPDKDEDISNGDRIGFTLDYNTKAAEAVRFTLKNTSEPIVVSGLEDLKLLTEEELKALVKVTVSGIAPNVDVLVERTQEGRGVYFEYQPDQSKIEEGGFARIKVMLNKNELMLDGYTTEKNEYNFDFPIEINERYASKPEEIGEAFWEKIHKEIIDRFTATFYVGGNQWLSNKGKNIAKMYNGNSMGEPTIKEAFLLYSKHFNKKVGNELVVIFETPYTGPEYGNRNNILEANFFTGVYVSNLVVDSEGNSEGTLLRAEISDGDFDYLTIKNKLVTQHLADYYIVEVPLEFLK